MIKMLAIILIVVLVAAAVVVLIDHLSVNVVSVDLEEEYGDMTHSATGFLYGLAEEGVPSKEITAALSPDTLVAKTAGGLQHPIGDVEKVSGQYIEAGGKAIQVYLQDIYPLWYYDEEGVEDLRADFIAKAPAALQRVKDCGYGDKLTVMLFNETDNGSDRWFGKFGDWKDGKLVFDDAEYVANRAAFYYDYKTVHNMAKALGLRVGGPNYCTYQSFLIRDFLTFCKQNDCLPDVIAWHELITGFGRDWEEHVKDYRNIEKELGIEPIKICVPEYGRMEDNGKPDAALMYISGFESYDVSACIAYWRLANNLCDLTADYNTPTASWWVYRWYAEMTGKQYMLSYDGSGEAYGISGGENGEYSMLLTGLKGKSRIEIQNLEKLFGENKAFNVRIEAVRYNGLAAATISPTVVSQSKINRLSDRLVVSLTAEADIVYRVLITKYNGEEELSEALPVRYEAEDANYTGMEKVGSVYAKSGGLMYKMTDKARIIFNVAVAESGRYKVDIVYGNGETGSERTGAEMYLKVDGKESKIELPSTLKYYYTEAYTLYLDLEVGVHELELSKKSFDGTLAVGSVCLDFIDVIRVGSMGETPVYDKTYGADKLSGDGVFMTVVPSDGYYIAETAAGSECRISVNGVTIVESASNKIEIFLRRGVNYVKVENRAVDKLRLTAADSAASIVLKPSDAEITGGNVTENKHSPSDEVITGVTDVNDGLVKFSFNTEAAGTYAVSVTYANNSESGVHSYNTDLVERYAVISVNGGEGVLKFFRNTYSDDTFTTLVFYVSLQAGANEISFANDGRYVWKGEANYLPDIALLTVTSAVAE